VLSKNKNKINKVTCFIHVDLRLFFLDDLSVTRCFRKQGHVFSKIKIKNKNTIIKVTCCIHVADGRSDMAVPLCSERGSELLTSVRLCGGANKQQRYPFKRRNETEKEKNRAADKIG
jgi:hypothetical protein